MQSHDFFVKLYVGNYREKILMFSRGVFRVSGNLETLTKEKNVSNQVSSIKSKFAVFSVY